MGSSDGIAIRTESGLVRAHGLAALAMVAYSALLGLAIAAKFVWPDWLASEAYLTWGRLRYAHTQGIFFGWLGNAFFVFLYYAVPRLAERPITSRGLGWLLFLVWNFGLVIPGWVLVQAGHSQPLELAEFPLIIDGVAVFAFVLAIAQFVLPFFRNRLSDLYVSGWYILGGLTFTAFAYAVGNFVPEFEPGARGASYSGLWIHDAVGLYITPLAVAIAYIVIPLTTGRPIYSHFLSMVGFWLLFLIYPLNGTHHFVFSSIPMDAQRGAIVASVYLGVDVILVVANLLFSLRGAGGLVVRDTALRFTWLGTVIYLIVSVQGSMQSLMPINRFVHFSDWVIGHSHLAMIGFASFTAIGGLLFVWQRTPGVRYNAKAADWSFWLLTIGLLLMVLDLTTAGLLQGYLWQSDASWMDSVRASATMWNVRVYSGGLVVVGFLLLAMSMLTGPRIQPRAQQADVTGIVSRETASDLAEQVGPLDRLEPAGSTPQPLATNLSSSVAWLRNAYVLTGIAGIGFFVLSFVVLAIWPNQELDRQNATARPNHLPGLSESEQRGRLIYAREGCMNCHSQLVRFVEADVRRFGAPGQSWEGENEFPQMWGTRRIGPDLSRERGRKSRDWQLVHLWNPRFVVPDSIMPPHPWLFSGSPLRPTNEALDLANYVEALGREAQLAGLCSPAPLPGMDPEEERRMNMFCDCGIPRTAGPAPVFASGTDAGERDRAARRGALAFAHNCSGCHGADGRGDGPAAEALLPRPRDLATARFSDRAVSQSLWFGVPGSSMPSFHDTSAADLRGLVAYVQSLGQQPDRSAQEISPEDRDRAVKLFRHNCASCHGDNGRGSGMSAGTAAPVPTDFGLVQPTASYAQDAVTNGVPGTSMPPWKDKLSEDDRLLLVRFVRSLYLFDGPKP